jgi:hypothetical protein
VNKLRCVSTYETDKGSIRVAYETPNGPNLGLTKGDRKIRYGKDIKMEQMQLSIVLETTKQDRVSYASIKPNINMDSKYVDSSGNGVKCVNDTVV